MRLAIVRQRYTPFGGAERFVERALEALGGKELEITVIAREWPAGDGASYRRVLLAPLAFGRAWRDCAFARAACREVARGGYDLVQSHERLACCDIFRAGDGVHREWLRQRARRRGRLARGLDRLSPYHRRLLAAERGLFASHRLRAVICNSRMVRDEILHHYAFDESRLHVISNAVDGERFHPRLRAEHRGRMRTRLGIPGAAPVFLLVGSGFERKGLDLLLEIWPRLRADARLVVVGHDRRLARYRSHAIAHGLAQRVHFAGPQDEVGPWYGAADAFVLPALYDPQPNAALEALSCGLPLLTSSKCGAAELVERGANGEVRDALDAEGWLAALDEWSDPQRCAGAARLARRAVEALTAHALQERYRALYASVLERR
ncbi:MAG: glycosyltransferase family 4 protein [Rhodocyclaceae bacterium]